MEKVFIAHGRNELISLKVKDFISHQLKKEPVILAEQAKEGLTVIEALEKYSEGCSFAIIILSGDDVTAEGEIRGRQNVVHELGYFQGKLGRNKVIVLKQKNVTLPSNISGLFYLEFDKDIRVIFEDLRKVLDKNDASYNTKQLKESDLKEITEFVQEMSSVDESWKKSITDELRPFVKLPPKQFLKVIKPILEEHGAGYKKQAMDVKKRTDEKRSSEDDTTEKKEPLSAMIDFASVLLIGPSEKIAKLCESAVIIIESAEDEESLLDETKKTILDMFGL